MGSPSPPFGPSRAEDPMASSSFRRIFLTGASTGLGAGLAAAYAQPGVTLGLVARRQALLEEQQAALEAKGATVCVYPADVSDTERMGEVAADFLERAGGADLVIANAGIAAKGAAVTDGAAAEVARLFAVNLIGVSNTLLPFVPPMLAAGDGVLVGISSMAGFRALPGRAPYSASKVAVRTFLDGMRMDLHGTGVHAMTICPGFVRTPLTEDNPEMMFVLDVDDAVPLMVDAIARRDPTFAFPWQMDLLRRVLTRAPESVVRKMAPKARSSSMS